MKEIQICKDRLIIQQSRVNTSSPTAKSKYIPTFKSTYKVIALSTGLVVIEYHSSFVNRTDRLMLPHH